MWFLIGFLAYRVHFSLEKIEPNWTPIPSSEYFKTMKTIPRMSNIRGHAKNVDKMGNLKLQPEGSGNKPGKKPYAFNLSCTMDATGKRGHK